MNRKQRVIRNAALGVLILWAVFPPWSYVLPGWSTQCFAGHHFVFTPPQLKSPDKFREMFSVYDSPGGSSVVVRIEYIRLIIEWLALLFIAAGLILILASEVRYLPSAAGGVGIIIGVALVVVWLSIPVCHAR